ncbi:hypothetical protein [Kribbella amoyensis]|uniref:hypothetical protein n=1 Tax=Kribbella amoyensis TaxID=996641 RepID=UPI00119D48A4|nr:hypothetical protein [Kribbella amoyensis]
MKTAYDDPRYPETLNRLREWNAKGYYYPDILATQITQAQTLFMNGTTYSITNGIGSYPALVSGVGKAFTVDVVRPYGTKPSVGLGNGIFSNSGRGGFTALKQAAPERIKLLLRVLDFLAAPFGSTEYELINYGVEGVHFTRSPEGDPLPTKLATDGGENNTNLPLRYIAAGPSVLYLPGAPEATRRNHAAQSEIVPLGIADPTVGLVSETQAAKGPKLTQLVNDALNEIIGGKRPVSDWASVVEQWKQQGGSAVTSEYAEQYTGR